MLKITIPAREMFDEVDNVFVNVKETTLQLEHSLVSLSKWEAIHQKPFLSKEKKTEEEILSYIDCMTITQNVDPVIFRCLTQENVDAIKEYIESPMSATTFSNQGPQRPNREIVTSELIYYWMVAYNIPFECQKWHINRLLTLIRICGIKNSKQKKMPKSEIASRQRALNEARRKAH